MTLIQDLIELKSRQTTREDKTVLQDAIVILMNLDDVLHAAHDMDDLLHAQEGE